MSLADDHDHRIPAGLCEIARRAPLLHRTAARAQLVTAKRLHLCRRRPEGLTYGDENYLQRKELEKLERTHVELVDDRDGVSAAAETVVFGLDKETYEIDLTAENAAELRELVGTWALYARVVEPSSPMRKPRPRHVYAVGPRRSGAAGTR
ncbi:Lsr2 dimerization domain-containing protein [Nocardia jiangxiensis]|uniref:Histone-like nucleoid-structuring protein Lsr2 n=1 Tax=Nocardia jiangxiensis TaxID=282685 RepID=A0ABW6RW53_9NOCA|nr:histone-like nucleoid-structuring protein Lsr2 [Nocardia jiangxiensis]